MQNADPGIFEIGSAIRKNAFETHALSERVDYLHVAVMRGDPRFTKPEHAKPDFDSEAFDQEWEARGRRVPGFAEIFGNNHMETRL